MPSQQLTCLKDKMLKTIKQHAQITKRTINQRNECWILKQKSVIFKAEGIQKSPVDIFYWTEAKRAIQGAQVPALHLKIFRRGTHHVSGMGARLPNGFRANTSHPSIIAGREIHFHCEAVPHIGSVVGKRLE